MSSEDLPNDHWVSRGYQQNFASEDKRVAVLDVGTGQIVDDDRPIKSNFSERGFTTFLQQGVPMDLLERAFASIESRVLDEIRNVHSGRRGPEQKLDVARLFAVHLVRSPSFRTFHAHLGAEFRDDGVPEIATEGQLRDRFRAAAGRPPQEQELLDLAFEQYDRLISDPMHLVRSMLRQLDEITEVLHRFHLQIVELDEGLPGFVIADTPVLHVATQDHRYGFRDHLAVGDADLIAGPLTRTTAACFTAELLPDVRFATRKRVDAWNALFIRGAQAEVACHPDDARGLRQTHSRLDRLPPSILIG